MGTLKRLWADFNEAQGDDIWTAIRPGQFIPDGEPHAGQWLELWDHEGNTCQAVVTLVDYPIVYLRLNPSTWLDSSRFDAHRSFSG